MDISGERRILAPRDRVWDALNDPAILKQCIPGCTLMDKTSDTEFAAEINAKVGPVKAKFTSVIELSDLVPPASYTISGQGKGGAAGFGKGSARVVLEADGNETLLRYEAQLQVGGKLAQIGSRLVAGATRKIANDFFSRFVVVVSPQETTE